ncbi:MAG: flagellar protein FliS [Pirellulales bacterium]|nr:flagellar protein FliS [Pirellulales bacterium]
MTAPASNNAYLETKFLTASPQRLQFMLVDGAVKFAKQAGEHWLRHEYEQGGEAMDRCEAILTEILKNIRVEQWEIAQSIAALYLFLRNLAIDAHFHHDQEKLAKLVSILETERETWRVLCEQAGDEPAAKAAPESTPAPIVPPLDATTGASGLSLEA